MSLKSLKFWVFICLLLLYFNCLNVDAVISVVGTRAAGSKSSGAPHFCYEVYFLAGFFSVVYPHFQAKQIIKNADLFLRNETKNNKPSSYITCPKISLNIHDC